MAVTGPEALTLAEAGNFEAISAREACRIRSETGEPPHLAEAWVSWFVAIENGEVSEVSDVVREVTGHPAAGPA